MPFHRRLSLTGAILLLLAASAGAAPSGWWNLNWRHSQWITITTGSAAVPAGYSVPVTFDHAALVAASKSRADGNDVRVAYWNGSVWTELDRVLDAGSSWNNPTTTIWIRLQAGIGASSFDDNYGLYYGNSGAGAPPANGNNVFLAYDGFESGDLSGWESMWTAVGDTISASTATVRSGTYAGQAAVDITDPGQASVRAEYAAQPGVAAVLYAYFPAGYNFNSDTSLNQFYGGFWGEQQLTVNVETATRRVFLWNNVAGEAYFGSTVVNTGQWYRLEMRSTVSPTLGRAELWVDGVREANEFNRNIGTVNIDNNLAGIYWKNSGPNTLFIDDTFTRMWVEPEPTMSSGAENTCCSSLLTTSGGSTVTVTAPGYFEMRFNTATGAGIDQFFDLAEDPGRSWDLAGAFAGSNLPEALFNAGMRVAGTYYNATTTGSTGTLHLLEATSTRVKLRQETFYRGGAAVLAGVKGYGDYSIYPAGRTALRWNRITTTPVTYQSEFNEWYVHRTASGTLSNWSGFSETDGVIPPSNPGTDDFLLAQIDTPGARTDFLNVIYKDWTTANGHTETADITEWFVQAGGDAMNFYWDDLTGFALPARSTESWNFLMYFKPTSFANNATPAVTSRRTDYRTPDPLSAIGPGSGWNENTADADFFNESEAAYTLDLNPASGLSFDLDGFPMTRYSPFFKIRQWRSLALPTSVSLEGTPLTRDVHFKADVKPVSRGHFAQDVLWHSTLENSGALETSPDVGGAGSGSTCGVAITYGAGRYGNGAVVGADDQCVWFPRPGHFDPAKGALEFWFQPSYNSTDGLAHNIGGNFYNGANQVLMQKRMNDSLYFEITASANVSSISVSSTQYSWRAGDWVHLRFEWDETEPIATQLRILVDGVEPNPGGGTGADYVAADLWLSANIYVGDRETGNGSPGVYDEIYMYGGSDVTPTALAHGGLTTNGSEYLADASRNSSFSFAAVDAQRRGEYAYFGSDAKFRGLNILLLTAGAGSSPNLQWQYWNGTAWANLEAGFGFNDETVNFTRTGTIYWTSDPTGWSPYSVNGGPDLYYVRAYLASGDYATQSPVERLIKTDILLFQYCADITAIDQTFVFAAPVPTAVELAGFSARGLDSAVELTWETASELDNLGFHLYRSELLEGPYERITSAAIPGLGSSPAGARYRSVDSAVTNGTTYFYKLEDIETTGETKLHGPVSATPAPDSSVPPPPETSGEIVYGSPESSSIRVVERNRSGLILEVNTEGFEAEVAEDGSLRLSIPGFEVASEPGTPAIPVKRSWVEVEAGRGVRVASVRAESVETFASLRPSATESYEIVASRRGTVRGGRRAQREGSSFQGAGFYPEKSARLVSVGYQGTTKKALLELSPLRWDRTTGRMVLARTLRVHLVFSGREKASHSEASHPKRATRAGVVRLVTRELGLYGVGFAEALGGRGVPSTSLRLSRQGLPVAFHVEPDNGVFGPGSRLYFWSEGASLNPYGREAVYELERAAGGVSMPRVSFEPSSSASSFYWQRVAREENRFYQAALLEAPDLWLWDLLFAPVEKSYSFEVRDLTSTSELSRISIWLQGTSDFEATPDHHLRVRLNGVPVAEAYLEGKDSLRLDADVPAGILREGENLVSIENVGDTAAAYSMVMLDRFTVEYPRKLEADGGKLEGGFGETGEVTIAGVSGGASVVDVTEERVRWVDSAPAAVGGVRLAVESGRRYAVVDPEAVARPEVRRAPRSTLQRESNQANYLMVGPRELLEVAAPLLALRRAQGLVSRAVPLEEIDSEFGYGESRPEAVREFLSYAYHHWRKPVPRYVLLLGDATYDYKDYLGTGVVNRLPALMVKTSYLWTASDPAYAAIHGDDLLPDLAIGRLPAANAQELRVMVDKILSQEASASSGAVVLVADNPDEGGDFERDAEDLASGVLASRDPRRIYLRPLGVDGTRQAIVDALDSGASLLSYVGHGGIQLWAHENLFDTSRVGSLQPQSKQPVVLTMNCLNGYFHFPYFNALSEELLKAEGKGAIAAFSPSGLSLNQPAHIFHEALLRELVSGGHERLGDAVLAAQEAYAASGAFPELLRIYHLLGDPALRLFQNQNP